MTHQKLASHTSSGIKLGRGDLGWWLSTLRALAQGNSITSLPCLMASVACSPLIPASASHYKVGNDCPSISKMHAQVPRNLVVHQPVKCLCEAGQTLYGAQADTSDCGYHKSQLQSPGPGGSITLLPCWLASVAGSPLMPASASASHIANQGSLQVCQTWQAARTYARLEAVKNFGLLTSN